MFVFGLFFLSLFPFLDIPGRWQWSTPPSRTPQAQFPGTHFAGEHGMYFQRHLGYEKEINRMSFCHLTSARE